MRIEQDLTHCPLGSFQPSQIPANANSSPSLTSKQLRLFGFTFAHLLVKAVGRNHPLAGFHRIAESGLRGRRFRPCVDHAGRDGRVLRPRGNQPPAHQRHLTDGFLGILANHGHGLGRSNVVAWAPVFMPLRRSRSFLDNLLSLRCRIEGMTKCSRRTLGSGFGRLWRLLPT